MKNPSRRLAVGAEVLPQSGVHFRVWAPLRKRLDVVLEQDGSVTPLTAEEGGWFSGSVARARAGDLYRYQLDGQDKLPDPASRFQPQGPHGPSQVVDPSAFHWSDAGWKGIPREDIVLYEMHVGTFTPEGTWEAAGRQLPLLKDLGITMLEVMPVAEFPGRFGWGYDGVQLFAPTRIYGTPDDFRRFVDRAHAQGLGVILDVVYNHLGPDGNYLWQYARDYFTPEKHEWGDTINFGGKNSGPIRDFFLANAVHWISEYHLDGFRFDAINCIFDPSPEHILAVINREVKKAAAGRTLYLAAENEDQEAVVARPAPCGGWGLDGEWNDDFHHAAYVAATGRAEAYRSDYRGTAQELLSAVRWGYLFQGQWFGWKKKRRGTPAFDLPPAAFVTYLQNHDQVGNSGRGLRLHQLTSPGKLRALTALWLLTPGTPMFFQGQEFAASTPFLFFADHQPELAKQVHEGRKQFLRMFYAVAQPEMQAMIDDPAEPRTFAACKLKWAEREAHAEIVALHHDLLKLRREQALFRTQDRRQLEGAVLGRDALALRFLSPAGDRLLLVNLGRDLKLGSMAEPLLAPAAEKNWQVLWSSEHPRYGGHGTPPPERETGWYLAGECAVVLG